MRISYAATRVAFAVIIIFVLAQVIWWLVFQSRYITAVSAKTVAYWQAELALANDLVASSQTELSPEAIQASFPQLSFDSGQNRFVIDQAYFDDFISEQRGYIRMFAYEGPFFVLVVLSGLLIIALSLRAERELKRRQQNFLSAITHEVKTPISTLRLLIETALMRDLSRDKHHDYLLRMESELSRIEQTSEQVLASARLEQRQQPPLLAAEDLNEVVHDIIAKSRMGLETQGAVLEVVFHPEPLPVSIDSQAFSLVINNLLDNAVKYTPQRPKPIRIELEEKNNLVMVHINDQGVGIAEHERRRIFERFYRMGSEMTRESKGVGLGLYLVKSITEAMHGWVKVESDGIRGTCFSIILPRRVGQDSHDVFEVKHETVSS